MCRVHDGRRGLYAQTPYFPAALLESSLQIAPGKTTQTRYQNTPLGR